MPVVPSSEVTEEAAAKVVIQFVVGDEGAPKELTVTSTTDTDMNEPALEQVSKLRLTPEAKGKKFAIPVTFNQAAVEKRKAELKEKSSASQTAS